MVMRAAILCLNYILFQHTMMALRKRIKKSCYPDMNIYKDRQNILNKLNQNRKCKKKNILKPHHTSRCLHKPKGRP